MAIKEQRQVQYTRAVAARVTKWNARKGEACVLTSDGESVRLPWEHLKRLATVIYVGMCIVLVMSESGELLNVRIGNS